MRIETSEYECSQCGKDLYKFRWMPNVESGDGYVEFCSKKCGKKFFEKYLSFQKEEI